MYWHCEGNDHIDTSYLSEEFCDEMFRYCEDNTYILVIVTYGSYIDLMVCVLPFLETTLVISMRTTLS